MIIRELTKDYLKRLSDMCGDDDNDIWLSDFDLKYSANGFPRISIELEFKEELLGEILPKAIKDEPR